MATQVVSFRSISTALLLKIWCTYPSAGWHSRDENIVRQKVQKVQYKSLYERFLTRAEQNNVQYFDRIAFEKQKKQQQQQQQQQQ